MRSKVINPRRLSCSSQAFVGVHRGYYLVRASDGHRFYIGSEPSEAALQRSCSAHLSEETGWDYWVDRSLGLDVSGRVAWINLDLTADFNL